MHKCFCFYANISMDTACVLETGGNSDEILVSLRGVKLTKSCGYMD